jgi:hypothetical protein
MAYGQLVDYSPHPEIPGAYNFTTVDGKQVLAGGAPAEELKARLDAAKSATTVAGDNAAPGFDARAAANDLVGRPGPGPAPTALASAAQAPPGPPQGGGLKPLMVNGINTGYEQDASGRLLERVAGTKGTSKADIEKKATQGTALATGQSESTSGGFDPNQEYLDARRANTEQAKSIDEQGRNAELTADQAGRAVAGDQFVAQTAKLNEQQRLVNDVQAHVDQQQAVRDQALKEYTGTKIDPERVFAGGAGFARRLGAALASAAGAWGATVGHTQNFAQQTIDNMISRDIAAQERDLMTKKDASDNALADLTRRGMSLTQAKGTLEAIQNNWAQQQLQLAKGSSSDDAINAKYDGIIANRTQKQLDADEAYRQESLGKATKAVQSQIVYPQAGSAGGLRAVAPGKALGIAGTTAGTEGTIAGTAKTIEGIGKGGKATQGDQKAMGAIATADQALKSLSAYGDDAVAQIPENQDVASRAYHGAKDFVLGSGASARGMSNQDRNLIQDTEAAKGYVKSLTSVLSGQGALSGPEAQVAERGLAPGATVGDLKRAVAILKSRAESLHSVGGGGDNTPEAPKE